MPAHSLACWLSPYPLVYTGEFVIVTLSSLSCQVVMSVSQAPASWAISQPSNQSVRQPRLHRSIEKRFTGGHGGRWQVDTVEVDKKLEAGLMAW